MTRTLVIIPLLALAAAATPPAGFAGKWKNPKDSVIIDVAACGEALCGTVTWASDKAKAEAAKAGTPHLVGTQLLSGFKPDGKGGWKGTIFVPTHRVRAGARVRLIGDRTLTVRGCSFIGMICKTQTWTRVD